MQSRPAQHPGTLPLSEHAETAAQWWKPLMVVASSSVLFSAIAACEQIAGTDTPITVMAAFPSEAEQGRTVQVRIVGSGFPSEPMVTWERDGVAEPLISVLDLSFVSESEILATISIGLATEIAYYDVVVRRGRKKGISTEFDRGVGTAAFRVTSLTGQLSFRYQGMADGEFAVHATWPFDPDAPNLMGTREFSNEHPDWAVAYPYRSGATTVLEAQRRRPDGWWDTFQLEIPTGPPTSTGTVQLNGYVGEFVVGTGGGGPLEYYLAYGGTVTFTSASRERLAGSFVLHMVDVDDKGSIEVTGSFDVPVISSGPYQP
jgi:hypothetical protein